MEIGKMEGAWQQGIRSRSYVHVRSKASALVHIIYLRTSCIWSRLSEVAACASITVERGGSILG